MEVNKQETASKTAKTKTQKMEWQPIVAELGMNFLRGFLTGVSLAFGQQTYKYVTSGGARQNNLLLFDGNKKSGSIG